MPQKVKALSDLLTEFEGPLTADFQRVYGLRLEEAVSSRSWDELLSLINWLPPGSAMHAAREGKPGLFTWTPAEDLLLSIVNLVMYNTYATIQVQTPKKIKTPKSIPGPRGDLKSSGDKQDAGAIARGLLDAQEG
jgi:hypothetical protein